MNSMKNKPDHSCRFVHHAKFYCIMITLNKLFKSEFERGKLEKSSIFEQFYFLIFRGGWETGKEPIKL